MGRRVDEDEGNREGRSLGRRLWIGEWREEGGRGTRVKKRVDEYEDGGWRRGLGRL